MGEGAGGDQGRERGGGEGRRELGEAGGEGYTSEFFITPTIS